MSETANYGLYIEDNDQTTFKHWREKINGSNESNTVIIDRILANKLSKDGSEKMEGDLDLGNNRVINVGVPVNDTDLVRKKEIDDHNESTESHPDIREQLKNLAGGKELFEIKAQTTDMVNVTSDVTGDQILEAYNGGKYLYVTLSAGDDETATLPFIEKIDGLDYTNMLFGVFLYGISIVLGVVINGANTTFNFTNEPIKAEDIFYDPSASSLSSDTVQSAIDELDAKLSGGAYESAISGGFIGTEDEFNKALATVTNKIYVLAFSLFTPNEDQTVFKKTLTDEEYNYVLLSAKYGKPIAFDEAPYLLFPYVNPNVDIGFLWQFEGQSLELQVASNKNATLYLTSSSYMQVDSYMDFSSLDTPINDSTYAYENFSNGFPLLATYNGETILLRPSLREGNDYIYENEKYALKLTNNGHTATLSLNSGGNAGENEVFVIPVSCPPEYGASTTELSTEEIIEGIKSGKQILFDVYVEGITGYKYKCYAALVLSYEDIEAVAGYDVVAYCPDLSMGVTAQVLDGQQIVIQVQELDVFTAKGISYDNSTSHLSANKVQAAIDELASSLTNLATEDYVTNAINAAIGNALEASY